MGYNSSTCIYRGVPGGWSFRFRSNFAYRKHCALCAEYSVTNRNFITCFSRSINGGSSGYYLGIMFGPKLESFRFASSRQKNIRKAKEIILKYGTLFNNNGTAYPGSAKSHPIDGRNQSFE